MSNIVRLTDLVQPVAFAELSVGNVEVFPVGVGTLARIVLRFPALLSILEGGKIGAHGLAGVAEAAPGAIPAFIAAGCGTSGTAGERAAERLTPGDQILILQKIYDVSWPEGISSFFDQLRRSAEGVTAKLAPSNAAPVAPPDGLEVVPRPD